jgi:hypothetical protein
MEKQQQILQMAKDICRVKLNCNDVCNPVSACAALKYAERAVEAGYRKQSEGEWTYGVEGTMKCTRCRRRMPKIDGARYCPNCGAKMKATEVSTTPAKKDYYTPEEVRSMSQKEVRENFEIIRRSMKMWR